MGAISAWREMLGSGRTTPDPNTQQIASPWSTGSLSTVVWSDIFGADDVPVTRQACMRIPAVARARHLITGIARQPLARFRGDTELEPQPWMYRTDTATAPQIRMAWTFDDLIFGGWSLWAVERGSEGQILDAQRVPPEWWEITPDNVILVNGQEVTTESVILFSGPFEGLMEAGAHTIRAAQNLEKAWAQRVKNPVAATELHQTTDNPLEEAEVRALVDEWGNMLDAGGGVAYTPSSIDLRTHGDTKTDLFIEARNAVTLDIGRLLNVPAVMLDASLATSSLQYHTSEDGRNSFIDQTVSFWRTPIEARLSMDDVVNRGQRVAFDLSNLVTIPQTGQAPATED